MIKKSKNSGADAIKLQTINPDLSYGKILFHIMYLRIQILTIKIYSK